MRRVVCFDAGHGGADPGTVRGPVEEEDITLDLADRVGRNVRLLTQVSDIQSYSQISTVFTRRFDATVSIDERVALALRNDADLLLSIHVNSVKALSDGALCIVSKDGCFRQRSGEIAGRVLDRLEECGFKNRHYYPDKKPFINYNRLGILHGVCRHMPAVLVEVGNVRNDHDFKLLTSVQGREVIAIAMARAIVEWFGLKPRMELLSGSAEKG
jgi:N-acetylmuramoyl-L-alanine amidase